MASINRQFKFEGWLMAATILLPLAVGLLAAVVAPILLKHLEVDRCLDNGGAYDYKTETCTTK
jgi:hypothetical protein